MPIINRTPHFITILAHDAPASGAPVFTLPAAPRGEVARVVTLTDEGTSIAVDGVLVPVAATRWGVVVGLPAAVPGTYHIVSAIVAAAALTSGRGTHDLLVPGDQVRDESNRIVGCRGLCPGHAAMPHLARGSAVWVAYTPADMAAFGVSADIITAAVEGNTTISERAPFTGSDRDAWDRLVPLYTTLFARPPVVGHPSEEGRRVALVSLVAALLSRPHRRTLRSLATDDHPAQRPTQPPADPSGLITSPELGERMARATALKRAAAAVRADSDPETSTAAAAQRDRVEVRLFGSPVQAAVIDIIDWMTSHAHVLGGARMVSELAAHRARLTPEAE